jgi:hypothetical protein
MLYKPALGVIYYILDSLNKYNKTLLKVLLNKFKALFFTKFNKSLVCYLNLIIVNKDLSEFIPEILLGFPCI